MRVLRSRKREQGMVLLEALIAILIFSIGILGLIGMQANAINASSEAKNRADAAVLANHLVGLLSVSDSATINNYAHRPSGTACAPTGSNSTDPAVVEWLLQVDKTLPEAASSKQQVKVDSANNVVTITICWQPQNGDLHKHVVTTQMQWQ